MNTNEEIKKLFDYLNKLTQLNITQIEITPIKINENIYANGIKITKDNKIEIHLTKIIKIDNTQITTEPKEEIYLNTSIMDKTVLATLIAFTKFNLLKINKFDVVTLEQLDEQNNIIEKHAILYDNKRIACKMTLNYKKTHPNTTHKIIHFGEKEMTELDIVTSPTV